MHVILCFRLYHPNKPILNLYELEPLSDEFEVFCPLPTDPNILLKRTDNEMFPAKKLTESVKIHYNFDRHLLLKRLIFEHTTKKTIKEINY